MNLKLGLILPAIFFLSLSLVLCQDTTALTSEKMIAIQKKAENMHKERISYPEDSYENKVWESPKQVIQEPDQPDIHSLLLTFLFLGVLVITFVGKRYLDKQKRKRIEALSQAKLADIEASFELIPHLQDILGLFPLKILQRLSIRLEETESHKQIQFIGFEQNQEQQMAALLSPLLVQFPTLSLQFERDEDQSVFLLLFDQKEQLQSEMGIEIPIPQGLKEVDQQFLQKAEQIVHQLMGNADFNAEAFREEMGMSKTHFYRKLQEVTQQSPGQYIRSQRLQEAKRLLEAGSGNVSEIAYEVGFNNLSYFSRCFRNEFGVLPSEVSA